MSECEACNCKRCGSDEFITREVGPHIGKYCASCGLWIKWISKPKQNFVIEEQEQKEPSPYDGDYFEDNDLPWEDNDDE